MLYFGPRSTYINYYCLKMAVLWVVAPCRLVKSFKVSEFRTASTDLMMEALGTSETLVK
jgi:hypothetical protein